MLSLSFINLTAACFLKNKSLWSHTHIYTYLRHQCASITISSSFLSTQADIIHL